MKRNNPKIPKKFGIEKRILPKRTKFLESKEYHPKLISYKFLLDLDLLKFGMQKTHPKQQPFVPEKVDEVPIVDLDLFDALLEVYRKRLDLASYFGAASPNTADDFIAARDLTKTLADISERRPDLESWFSFGPYPDEERGYKPNDDGDGYDGWLQSD